MKFIFRLTDLFQGLRFAYSIYANRDATTVKLQEKLFEIEQQNRAENQVQEEMLSCTKNHVKNWKEKGKTNYLSRWIACFTACACVVSLSSCASLPTSGPVNVSTKQRYDSQAKFQLHANPPAVGAGPEEIVQGFILATQTGYGNNFQLARKYLTNEAAQEWNPFIGVTIYENTNVLDLSKVGQSEVKLKVKAIGSVDTEGVYTQNGAQATYTGNFKLLKTDKGEWRISELDNGVVLSHSAFEMLFKRTPLFFYTPDRRSLVADERWFLNESLLTLVTQGLLKGPVSWLKPAVYTAIPTGASLGNGSVIMDNGVARLNFSSVTMPSSQEEKMLLLAQIRATLQTASSQVQQVEISVGGISLQSEQFGSNLSAYPYVDNGLYALANGKIGKINGESFEIKTEAPDARSLAISYDDEPWLAITGKRGLYIGTEGKIKQVLKNPDLVPPSWDRNGWVWTRQTGSNSAMVVSDKNINMHNVRADWLQNSLVYSLKLSRDGSRMALVRANGNRMELDLSAVVRDVSGQPQSLETPIVLPLHFSKFADMAWIDRSTLAVLCANANNVYTIYLVDIGGFITTLTPPDKPRSVAGSNGEDSLVIDTPAGLFRRNGNTWNKMQLVGSWPAYAG